MTAARTPTPTSSGPRTVGLPSYGGRPRLAAEIGIALVAIGLGLVWLVHLMLRASATGGVDGADSILQGAWAFDLAAYVNAAARLLDEGTLYTAQMIAVPYEPGSAELYYYAPPIGVAMLPFTGLPLADSAIIWWAVRVTALLSACLLMPVRPSIRALAFAVAAFSLPGLKDSILGNVSLILVLPMVLAWRWMDRPIGSLALAASMSLRPGLGVFLIWQLLRRQWRAAIWTLAGGLVLLVLTLPFVGLDGYRDFLAVIGNLRVPAGASENLDLGATAIALGADDLAGLARLLSISIASAAILLSLRRDPEISFMVALGASLLLVPLLWDHYLATLVLPAAFLAQRLHIAFILLPLLSWLPFPSAILVVIVMLLPLRAGDDTGTRQPAQEVAHLRGEPASA